MTPPDKKPVNRSTGSLRQPLVANTTSTAASKPVIATPPRAALHGQTRTKDDNSSLKSARSTATSPESDDEDEAGGKDAKIAELEKEVRTMEAEFEKELTTLSHRLTTADEALHFWQQKHSTLNQTYLKSDTELRVLKADIQQVEGREQEFLKKLSEVVVEREKWREAYTEALVEVREKDTEIRALQGQVRGLKSWVSSSGKGEEQVADEVFGEAMCRLGNGLQNWIIVNFRRIKIDVEKADEKMKEQLLELIPTYESLAATSKIHLVQSLVSRLLVESVFQPYFVGLSKDHAEELQKVEKTLGSFGPAESINLWRATTLAILRKEAPQKLQSEITVIIDSVIKRINTIMTSISDIQPSESRDQSLRALIKEAIELSQLLRAQKAVFTIVMPSLEHHQKTMFDPDSMEDMGGEDEDSLSDREIRCVTFPGVFKAGDEHGERGYLKNVVSKIRVVCAPD